MQQIINFFIRNKNFLLFLLLFSIGISLSQKAHSGLYTRYITSSNQISGGIFSKISDFKNYFYLKKRNETLSTENVNLLKTNTNLSLFHQRDTMGQHLMQSLDSNGLIVIQAHVINNNYHKRKNTLTIDKGTADGVKTDMGVVSSNGVLGVITHVSQHYCIAQSVLNTSSRVIVKSKNSNHFGTLIWPGEKEDELLLTEIPKIAPINLGDSLVTDGKSTIFPRGWPVGQVIDIQNASAEDYLDIRVKPFTDMTDLYHVYLLQRPDAKEIKELENTLTHEL